MRREVRKLLREAQYTVVVPRTTVMAVEMVMKGPTGWLYRRWRSNLLRTAICIYSFTS